MSIRPVKRLIQSKPTLEGAGVHLRRAFGFGNTKEFDPFLLLDDFRNDVPEDYLAGFPWHPHRGIETITYVLAGTVEHGDSMGNSGAIAAGDVQWMTAGSGIIHQEMPKGDQAGRMHGFQLWANLPSSLKMTAPRYQEVKALDIPEITDDNGTHVRVVWRLEGSLVECQRRAGEILGDKTEGKESESLHCRFHDLRHTAVTRLLEAGIPYPVVASIMGWSAATAIRMAKGYGQIGNQALRAAADVLGGATLEPASLKKSPKSLERRMSQCSKWKKRNGSSGRTRTYNPPVNS